LHEEYESGETLPVYAKVVSQSVINVGTDSEKKKDWIVVLDEIRHKAKNLDCIWAHIKNSIKNIWLAATTLPMKNPTKTLL
jgi:hypothetical protein